MSSLPKEKDHNSEIKERSEEELEEEVKNQQTIDIFIESIKNYAD